MQMPKERGFYCVLLSRFGPKFTDCLYRDGISSDPQQLQISATCDGEQLSLDHHFPLNKCYKTKKHKDIIYSSHSYIRSGDNVKIVVTSGCRQRPTTYCPLWKTLLKFFFLSFYKWNVYPFLVHHHVFLLVCFSFNNFTPKKLSSQKSGFYLCQTQKAVLCRFGCFSPNRGVIVPSHQTAHVYWEPAPSATTDLYHQQLVLTRV